MQSLLSLIAILFATPLWTLAQSHEHASSENLGSVNFETSCAPAVHPQFDRAVALMHSFQFGRAIEAFHSILASDPSCAVSYWGIALSSWGNPFAAGLKSSTQLVQGLRATEQGLAASPKTERERAYIEAVAHLYTDSAHSDQPSRMLSYETAMGALAAAYPADTEAKIFYALSLAAAADPADKTYAKQLQAGALLEALFVKYPNHPGLAHYIIHAYDVPPLAARAAEAARRYSQIAPSAPHALHMPSHTFTRIGDWQASIDTNQASASAARAAGQPADELHANDYMVYAYLQTAQDNAALQLVQSSAQAFQRFDPATAAGASGPGPAYFAHAAIPARYCLERHAWAEAAKLEPHPSPLPFTGAITYFAIGLGAAHSKNLPAARAAINSLQQLREKLDHAKETYWVNQVDIQRREVAAWLAFAEGDSAAALAGIRAAAEMEDKTEKNAITPGPLAPARELLGDMLLELKQPSEAMKEFEKTLSKDPNRFWSLYGAAEAAKLAGNPAAARSYFQKLLTVTQRADQPGRPQLVEAHAELKP